MLQKVDRVQRFTHRVCAALLQPVVCDSLERVGRPHDGGYVVPIDALRRASTLLSFGLAMEWSFERDAAAINPALRIQAYDHTVSRAMFRSMAFRAAVSVPLRLLSLSPGGARSSWRRAASAIEYLRFFSGAHRHHERRIWYNRDNNSADIADVIDSAGTGLPLSLFAKIDVEGSEYRIIPALCARAHLFSGLVIEFHDTDTCAELFNAQLTALRRDFEVVHVHGNNFGDVSIDRSLPLCLEVSFLNKQLMPRAAVAYDGPLPRSGLDYPNDPRRPDFPLQVRGPCAATGR
jgi:hypothetical protein